MFMVSPLSLCVAVKGHDNILLVDNLTLDVLPLFVPAMYIYTQRVFILRTTLPILHMIVCPVIWIITLSKNGHIFVPMRQRRCG